MTGRGTLAGLFSRELFPVGMASPTGFDELYTIKSTDWFAVGRAARIENWWQAGGAVRSTRSGEREPHLTDHRAREETGPRAAVIGQKTRAEVARSTAMEMLGHKTESIY
jgi:hypothetical protein